MKTNGITKTLLILMIIILVASVPGTAEAAGPKAVKNVTMKIGSQKVTKKTYTLQKGKTAAVKVTVNPSKAKKSVAFKSSNKKVVTVSRKGKVTAKKTGTAKVTVMVKGKDGKKKTAYVKIKVVKAHKHAWKEITKRKYVIDERAWDEDVYEEKWVCGKDDFYSDSYDEIVKHSNQTHHSWGRGDIKVGTIHHDETGHYETVVVGRKCKICGALK